MPDDGDAGGLGPLAGILGLNIRLAHGAVQRHFAEHSGDLGLTQKQVSVLWLVGDHEDTAQTDLARRLQMDRATTMTLVHALERRGLVERGRSAADARRVALRLTARGRAALAAARDAVAANEAWLGGRFTAKERILLEGLLRRIHAPPR